MPTEISPDVSAVLDCLADPAILLSTDYRILLANRHYRDIYGDGQPLRVLHVHHTPRGEEYVNVQTLPVRGQGGEIKYLIEVLKPDKIAHTRPASDGLIGYSPGFRQVLDLVNRVAPSDTAVLLLGESGTGKELVAKTVHERSGRRSGPFVPVECVGLPESLFESELFGHEKGAFTGAQHRKQGLVEAAEGGTLFLDEIGDLPLSVQVKLLRLLETRSYRRVGNAEAQQADFRLICATNKNLATMVRDGHFREDLYYRINVFEIHLLPLRERIEDLPLLVESMLKRLAPERSVTVVDETLACLASYSFPGNIRELKNIIERALLLTDSQAIKPPQLPPHCRGEPTLIPTEDEVAIVPLAEVEERYLRGVVSRYQGDRRSLAKRLGLSERALYRKLAKLRS